MTVKRFPVSAAIDHGYGFKFLNPRNATNYFSTDYVYPVPGHGEKWGPWFTHPEAAPRYDGRACGPNGLHVMRSLDTSYAPTHWYPWFAEYSGVLGYDVEKVRVRSVRLRRITPQVYYRLATFGWLAEIQLRNLTLDEVMLRDPDFRFTHLAGGHLDATILRRANFSKGRISRTKFYRAKSERSSFRFADIEDSYFIESRFYSNDFEEAALINCFFLSSVFEYTHFDEAVISNTRFSGSVFNGCRFRNTQFRNVNFRGVTFDRVHFDRCLFENVKVDADTHIHNSIVNRPISGKGCEDLDKLFKTLY